MKGFDRLNIKSAVKSVKQFDLSETHLTTMEFGQPTPLYCKQLMPRDKFSVKGGFFSRMAPLAKPTYGRFSFRTASFFVPMFQICEEADAFLNNQRTWEGQSPALRYILMSDYVKYLILIGYPVSLASGETDGNDGYIYDSGGNRVKSYDFKYINSSGTKVFLNFRNANSRPILRVLNSLGYALPTGVDLQPSSSWWQANNTKKVNAMPILAYFKALNDWLAQSTRFDFSQTTSLLHDIRHNINVSGSYSNSNHCITDTALNTLFTEFRLCYESDYFTTAWQYPNGPISSRYTENVVVSKNDPSGNDLNLFATLNSSNATISSSLSDVVIDWIQSVAAYARRNNYSGSRAVEKMLSRFGIKSEDFKSNYAHLLDTDVIPVNVGDVTAQAQTYGSTPAKDIDLGDYAGKGISSGASGFSFDSKDYGYLFVIGWYTVNPMYPYGFDRQVLSVEPVDFYQPEFDGVGPEVISAGEVNTNPIASDSDSYKNDDLVFGFTERYNSYRFGRDKITGDFRDQHSDADMAVWHCGRNLNAVRAAGSMVAQASSMNTMPFDSPSQFNRIFSVTDSSVDHFYLSAQFNVKAQRPMLNLNQVPRLGEGNVSVARNGNEVN